MEDSVRKCYPRGHVNKVRVELDRKSQISESQK